MVAVAVAHVACVCPICTQAVVRRADPSASLDHVETNAQPVPRSLDVITTAEAGSGISFRHSGWESQRRQVRHALAAAGVPDARLLRWDSCGSDRWLMRTLHDPPQYRIRANCCHDRFCKPCASSRSRLISNNLAGKISSRKHRLITLTLRSTDETLVDLIRLLYKSFSKLRRSRLWQDRIDGGCCFLEVKYNATLERWHPHLHIIAEGRWLDQRLLSRLWKSITRTSWVVDVRLIRDAKEAVAYVTKYASKPLSNSFVYNQDRLQEAVVALSGTRLCMTFGSWRGWELLLKLYDGPWLLLDPLRHVVHRAEHGSIEDLRLLNLVGLTVESAIQERAPPGELNHV